MMACCDSNRMCTVREETGGKLHDTSRPRLVVRVAATLSCVCCRLKMLKHRYMPLQSAAYVQGFASAVGFHLCAQRLRSKSDCEHLRSRSAISFDYMRTPHEAHSNAVIQSTPQQYRLWLISSTLQPVQPVQSVFLTSSYVRIRWPRGIRVFWASASI